VFVTQERTGAAIAIAIEELPLRYRAYVPNFGSYGDARVLADLAREANTLESDYRAFLNLQKLRNSSGRAGRYRRLEPLLSIEIP
jgi:hypothetical protein